MINPYPLEQIKQTITPNDRSLNFHTQKNTYYVTPNKDDINYIPSVEEILSEIHDTRIDRKQFFEDVPKGLKPNPSTLWDNLK